MRYYYDFVVVGSGIAGLFFALKVAPYGKVAVLTKTEPFESNTRYAQGGIAAAQLHPESIEKHVEDTLKAGAYLNDVDVVRMTVSESAQRIRDLIELGVHFDKTQFGEYELSQEGGHSEKRVFHVKDHTGETIQKQLLQKALLHPNIDIYADYFVLELITQHHLGVHVTRYMKDITCFGVYAFNQFTNQVDVFLSRVTMLASGGCGAIYEVTSNPLIATGDGVAMAYRAKAWVKHMEFIQFHPTALHVEGLRPSFLITEALRGEGAVLCTETEYDFVKKYHPAGSLAPRDVVARAIYKEMQQSGKPFVYLDCRHLGKELLLKKFPTIYRQCLIHGIDISKDLLPVTPAAHYQVGGVQVDINSCTTIRNLYASGECACTGLHGANRLASNSLLEAVVFSHRAAEHALGHFRHIQFVHDVPDWNTDGLAGQSDENRINSIRQQLQKMMMESAGIVRSKTNLQNALSTLHGMYTEIESMYDRSFINTSLCELRNMINTSYLILRQAIERENSIGLHYLEE